MAPPFPIADSGEADDIMLLDRTSSNSDRILLKELLAPSMAIHRSPIQPSTPTVCVHGYASLQFVVDKDMDRLMVVTIPRHGNGGITFLATATKVSPTTFEHLVPWINFKDNSGVERNFQQYGVMARTIFSKVTGYATTSTYVSGLCSGTTVADMRNVESYTREGLENATMHLPDFVKDELTTCQGIVNVIGPEGMTPIADQNTSITEIERSWYRHATFHEIDYNAMGITQSSAFPLLNWSIDPQYYTNYMTGYITGYNVYDLGEYTLIPCPMINPTISGVIRMTPGTGLSSTSSTFAATLNIAISYLWSQDGVASSMSTRYFSQDMSRLGTGTFRFYYRPEDYVDIANSELSDGVVVNVIGICCFATIFFDGSQSNYAYDFESEIKLGGCRDPFDFTGYGAVTLLQQLQQGVAFSVESVVDYVAIPNKISRNLLTSVGAQASGAITEALIDYAKAMQIALFYFDGIGGMRCHTAVEYNSILENVAYMGETRINTKVAEASSGRRIKKFFKQAGKTVFKDVLKPLSSHAPTILRGVSDIAQMTSPAGSVAKNLTAASNILSGMPSLGSM